MMWNLIRFSKFQVDMNCFDEETDIGLVLLCDRSTLEWFSRESDF